MWFTAVGDREILLVLTTCLWSKRAGNTKTNNKKMAEKERISLAIIIMVRKKTWTGLPKGVRCVHRTIITIVAAWSACCQMPSG